MNQISLDKTPVHRRILLQLSSFIPNPRPKFWWLDIVWVVGLGVLQEIIIPSLAPSWLHIDLLTPWLVFNVITRIDRSVWLIYLLTAIFMEGSSSVPAGFYFTVYFLPVVVIPIVRGHLTWSFFTPWFVSYSSVLLWVHGFKFFVHAVLADSFYISIYNVLFILSAASFGTLIGSILSRPYQSSEFFVKEGIV